MIFVSFFFFRKKLIFFLFLEKCSGYTDHFTNFAILLGGGGEDECGDGSGYTIAYLSIAFIIVAIIIIIIASLWKEREVRTRAKHITRKLSQTRSRSATINSARSR